MNDRKDTSQLPELPEELLIEAAGWWLRRQESPEDQGLAAELAAWRRLRAEHEAAWQLAAVSWRQVADGRLKRSPRLVSVQPRRLVGAVTALAACFLAAVLYPDLSLWLRSDHRTGTGVTREITLPDRSIVTLGADSAFALHFSGEARSVELLQGEAYFDVAPDAARPFTVIAQNMTVTVTGTEFAVATFDDGVDLSVAEGSVHVAYREPDGNQREADLRSGDHIGVSAGTGVFAHSKIEPANVAPWRSGRLVAQDMSLADVVASIDRYQPGIIRFADGALAERRVTGVFSLTDPSRALEGAIALYGGEIHHLTPYLTVLTPGAK